MLELKRVLVGVIATLVLGSATWISATVIEHGNLIAAHGAIQQMLLEGQTRIENKVDSLLLRGSRNAGDK